MENKFYLIYKNKKFTVENSIPINNDGWIKCESFKDSQRLLAYYERRGFFKKHGSAYDRGASDAYYGRIPIPHYFLNNKKITDLTDNEIVDYFLGFNKQQDKKDWGSL